MKHDKTLFTLLGSCLTFFVIFLFCGAGKEQENSKPLGNHLQNIAGQSSEHVYVYNNKNWNEWFEHHTHCEIISITHVDSCSVIVLFKQRGLKPEKE